MEREDHMRCASCGNELTENAKFCISCGAPVRIQPARACPVCGSELPSGTKYCIYCGTKISGEDKTVQLQPAQERFCSSCGEKIYPGQKFCRICGTSTAEEPAVSMEPDDESRGVLSPASDGSGRRLILTCLSQPALQYSAPIADSVTIGRSGTDILIQDDREVSRMHCRITLSDGQLYLTDEGSRNGTIYCGRAIPAGEPVLLQSGDTLEIGRYTYSVQLE